MCWEVRLKRTTAPARFSPTEHIRFPFPPPAPLGLSRVKGYLFSEPFAFRPLHQVPTVGLVATASGYT